MPDAMLHRPTTLGQAIEQLAADEDARCLAGGQTLVAMMNAKLVEPSALIALSGIAELHGIAMLPGGGVRIGAMTLHREIATTDLLGGGNAVLRQAAARIAHPAVRNMGTIGGAVSHGDPAADYPAALVAARAEIELAGAAGRRRVGAAAFFQDYLTTDLRQGELVTAILLPGASAGMVGHYLKFSRVDGDYATVSVAVCLTTVAGECRDASIALGSCGPTPVRADAADAALVGSALDEEAIAAAGRILAEASDPVDDVRGSAEYRKLIVPGLVRRAVLAAGAQREAQS